MPLQDSYFPAKVSNMRCSILPSIDTAVQVAPSNFSQHCRTSFSIKSNVIQMGYARVGR
jgi:hypothetical protein